MSPRVLYKEQVNIKNNGRIVLLKEKNMLIEEGIFKNIGIKSKITAVDLRPGFVLHT